MKTIIALVCALALCSAATNLITDGGITTSIEITANAANSSNVDVAFMLDYPDTFPAEVEDASQITVCFQAAASDYAIANSSTAIVTWATKFLCAAGTGSCDAITELGATFHQTSGTAGATTAAGLFNTGTLTNNTATFTATSNATTNILTETATAITPAQMTTAGLPNTTQTFYYRCFGKYGAATAGNIETGITGVAASITGTGNVTLKGSSSSVAAILAVAGSLAASFAF